MRPPRKLIARYPGTCAACTEPIDVDAPIWHLRRGVVTHESCGHDIDTSHLPTTRDRLEAKAEKRDQWADARAGRAETGFARAHELASIIPFGQPILVGHYSEGRDRNYRARIETTGFRAVADQRAAEHHASTAAGIRSQLAGAIYDDDPDAIERLRARIAEGEAERAAINAYNKAARKGEVTPKLVAALAPKWRSRYADGGEPIASYATANLSGNLSRQRQRLARLERHAQ